MQLGVRWRAGEPPHSSLPAPLRAEVAAQETAHPEARSWTLTWLEGRARCMLDDLVLVSQAADGSVRVDDPSGPAAGSGADRTAGTEPDDTDDDDDWLLS